MNAQVIESESFRIYVACLAAYNSGFLHGEWIDIEDLDENEIFDKVQAMLKKSPVAEECEEWAIHDYELPFSIGESEDFDNIVEQLEIYKEHGAAWIAYRGYIGEDYATVEKFKEAYQGEYDKEIDYAYHEVEETGLLSEVPETFKNYFDYESFSRDLFTSDYNFVDGYVFSNV